MVIFVMNLHGLRRWREWKDERDNRVRSKVSSYAGAGELDRPDIGDIAMTHGCGAVGARGEYGGGAMLDLIVDIVFNGERNCAVDGRVEKRKCEEFMMGKMTRSHLDARANRRISEPW